jgi:hypothetical protein
MRRPFAGRCVVVLPPRWPVLAGPGGILTESDGKATLGALPFPAHS